MMSPQPLAVVALARRFDLRPGAAAVLVAFYRTRHHLTYRKLSLSKEAARVYVSQIRGVLGAHAVTCDYQDGYLLGDTARKEVRQALEKMAVEVQSFIQPLLVAA